MISEGSVKAIEQDYIQQEIARSAYEYQKAIESGERIIVGVNKFDEPEPSAQNLFRVDDAIRNTQINKLNMLKAERDNAAVQESLDQLKSAAQSDSNLMPYILSAVEHYATLGEIANTLRCVFGEY